MARGIDSDYIDFSHMGGFDMGINFDGFEENVKKFMELPIKYLDSAHDKAVEFIEDVHAIFCAPLPDDKVPDKEDQSSSSVTTESSPTSVETELVGPNAEAATPPASLITVENNSTGCVDTDAHEIESFSTKSTGLSLMNHVDPEKTSSKGGHIEANGLYLLPEDTSTTGIYDSSEEVILWNPETFVKPPRPPDDLTELTTISQDDHVPHALDTDKVIEQIELHCSGHSDSSVFNGAIPLENSSANYEEQKVSYSANDPVGETMHDILVDSAIFYGVIPLENSSANYEDQMVLYSANGPVEATTHGISISHDLSTDVFSVADDPNMTTDDMVKFVDIDLRDGQEHMKNDKIEASPVPQLKNASFKKMFMRSLSSKLRWSKKQPNTHHAMPAGSQDAENLGYQMVSSSDDLEDDWEVV